jgi:hypothetical protein
MSDAMAQLPQYQSHKKVWALKILELNHTGTPDQESDGSLMMVPVNAAYAPIKLTADFVRKHSPKVGGYWVQYEDGYTSFSPAEAFENGYTLIAR